MKKLEVLLFVNGALFANTSFYEEEENLPVLLEAWLRKVIFLSGVEGEPLSVELTEYNEEGGYVTTDSYRVLVKSFRDIRLELE